MCLTFQHQLLIFMQMEHPLKYKKCSAEGRVAQFPGHFYASEGVSPIPLVVAGFMFLVRQAVLQSLSTFNCIRETGHCKGPSQEQQAPGKGPKAPSHTSPNCIAQHQGLGTQKGLHTGSGDFVGNFGHTPFQNWAPARLSEEILSRRRCYTWKKSSSVKVFA